MSHTYPSTASPSDPSPSATPTIPLQDSRTPTSLLDISDEARRCHQVLNERRSQQDDVELIWERERQRLKEREATEDKFATLFEPPTPRASPALLPSLLPPATTVTITNLPLFDHPQHTPFRRQSWRISRPNSISSNSSSDFGPFVEATEDPLSFTPSHETPMESGFMGGDATPSAAHAATPLSSSPMLDDIFFKRRPPSSHSNTTLAFFDTFTHHAKQRSSIARSQVMDELLLHEDDPMWFVLQGKNEVDMTNNKHPINPPLDALSGIPTTDSAGEPSSDSDETEKKTSSILHEIDHDYFRPSLGPSSYKSPRSLSPMRPRIPSRSSSIPPPSVAPPVACRLTASPPASRYLEIDSFKDVSHTKPPITSARGEQDSSNQAQNFRLDRSTSFNSLSSKLMSSLLRGAQSSPSSFSSPELVDAHSSSETTLDSVEEQTMSSSIDDTHNPVLSVDDSKTPRPLAEFSTMSPASEWRSSRFSASKQRIPFAPAIVTHSTSPFAAPFYTPPSGAPGFKGDRYDWDKGFSEELESERKGSSYLSAGGNGSVSGTIATNSRKSGSRGGWGTSFGFGFGPVGANKSISQASSPSSSVLTQGNGLNGRGREGGSLVTLAQGIGSDTSDWQDHNTGFNCHERHASSTSSTDTGSTSGMGDLIERKGGNIELVGRRESSDSVLIPELASILRPHLPALARLPRSWVLIYSLDQHGISLNTLYSRCEAHLSRKVAPSEVGISKGMLLAIKDSGAEEEHRATFGAWIAEGLKLNKSKGYSGGGESFLWKYVDGILKVFEATGKNNYIALCEADCISFGGGDGHYGLYLDDTLFEGSSASCPTFDNEPLCTGHIVGNLRAVGFECLGLEVWGMT